MNRRDKQRMKRLDMKSSILRHYGKGECACVHCGFSDIRALSIDHIDGNGAQHRKSIGRGGLSFYRWLFDNDFPEGYQTLCMNCQFIKSYRYDIPMSRTKAVAKRVHLWVDNREQPFYLRDVIIGLGLSDKEKLSLRVEVCRLKKAGIIRAGGRVGYYKKGIKPVKPVEWWL